MPLRSRLVSLANRLPSCCQSWQTLIRAAVHGATTSVRQSIEDSLVMQQKSKFQTPRARINIRGPAQVCLASTTTAGLGSRERTRATAIRSQLDNHSPMALLLAVMKVQVNIHELQHLQTKPAPKTSATMRLSPGHKCASARLTNVTLQLHDPSLEPRRCHHPSMGATTSHRARPLTHKDDGTPMVLGDLLSETMPTLRG